MSLSERARGIVNPPQKPIDIDPYLPAAAIILGWVLSVPALYLAYTGNFASAPVLILVAVLLAGGLFYAD